MVVVGWDSTVAWLASQPLSQLLCCVPQPSLPVPACHPCLPTSCTFQRHISTLPFALSVVALEHPVPFHASSHPRFAAPISCLQQQTTCSLRARPFLTFPYSLPPSLLPYPHEKRQCWHLAATADVIFYVASEPQHPFPSRRMPAPRTPRAAVLLTTRLPITFAQYA